MIQKGRAAWLQEEGTRFIVVDLDVFSRRRLKALADAFGDRVIVLHEGRYGSRYSAHFELPGWNQTADQQIQGLIAVIEKLPKPVRTLWDRAQSREFNIGIQAGLQPRLREFKLAPRTIALIARVRATFVITVYAPEEEMPTRSKRRAKAT